MTPDNQTRIVEGIVSMIELSVAEATAAQKTLKEQVTQVSSHGRNLEDSLRVAREKFATLEEQASTMTRHGRTLQDSLRIAHDEITRLTRALESDTPSASRLKSIKLDVAKFGGAESAKLPRWLLQFSTAADAQRIPDDTTRVAFAISHLKGRAEDWAFSKLLTDRHCFPSFAVFETELKAMFLPPNSDFRYRSQYLACKQGKRSLQEFIHDLRFLAANINYEESLSEALRVTVFMDGLNQGPALTQLFHAYPDTFEEADRIALSESCLHPHPGIERPHVFQLRSPWTLFPYMSGTSPCGGSSAYCTRFLPCREIPTRVPRSALIGPAPAAPSDPTTVLHKPLSCPQQGRPLLLSVRLRYRPR
ncbi:hypothetical protein DYB25_010486 [Aphanomyces astaci]|uniref:Retrotransposon gag domain-containing protein n=2 Tax=Aphanomyces astaci TaxID=112090 RepID=A0A397ADY7_APHAT|nr:hypothetical protein DYB25_010486 [Aphanomyces astaci]